MGKKFKSTCNNCSKEFYHGSSSTGRYCNNKCQRANERRVYFEKLLSGELCGIQINRVTVYKHLVEQKGNCCEICKLTDWNSQPIRLWVDHIDGCATNNNWSNFRLICPNCDSQLDTCRAKNKGKGRKSLGLKVF